MALALVPLQALAFQPAMSALPHLCSAHFIGTSSLSMCIAPAPAAWQHALPNALTAGRVLAIPLLVCAFYAPRTARTQLAAAMFTALSLTDFVDGYLARKWRVMSDFGAFLDPVADKLLVCTVLVMLAGSFGAVVAMPAALIVCREIGISALREWMAISGSQAKVAVGWSGKLKTATQMAALLLLLLASPGTAAATASGHRVGIALLYISAGLATFSALQLAKRALSVSTVGEDTT